MYFGLLALWGPLVDGPYWPHRDSNLRGGGGGIDIGMHFYTSVCGVPMSGIES